MNEERDCSLQIMLGSRNTDFCVLFGLAVFVEEGIREGEGAISLWLFVDGVIDSSTSSDVREGSILCLLIIDI